MTTTQTVTIEWLREDFCHWIEYRCSQLGFAVSGRHTKMAKWIQGPNPMKVCMGWRGCGKTYWLGREYILWRWLRNPWIKVLSICNTDANAGNVTSSVLEILRSEPAVQKYAPRRLVAEKFFDLVGFKPEKGRSIRAAGIDTTLTSERADLIVVDDPESDAEPETRYERILAVLDECMAILSSPNRLYPGREVPPQERTQLLVLGQPHWIGSAYIPPTIDPITKEVPPHPLRSADWLWIPALVDEHDNPCDEEPHCQSSVPEIHSTDLMLAKKAAMRPQKWRLEFQLDVSPENAERAVILLDHIRRRVVDPAHPIAVVDPADSGDSCVLPGAVVSGIVSKGMKTWYDGPAVKFTTASGRSLELTPNHPVMTLHGWRRANDLQRGDQLPRCSDRVLNGVAPLEENANPAPSAIEEVFNTLLRGGPSSDPFLIQEPVVPAHFHGDGRMMHGDVHVVSLIHKPSDIAGKTGLSDRARDLLLEESGWADAIALQRASAPPPRNLPRIRVAAPQHAVHVLDSSPHDIATHAVLGRQFNLRHPGVVVGNEGRRKPNFRSTAQAPGQFLRVGGAANFDATKDKFAAKNLVADPVFLRALHKSAPGEVVTDRIVEVSHRWYSGWVYDLESPRGFIVANGFPISNCEWGFAVAGLEGDRICFCNLTGYTEDQVMELKSIDDHELVADLMWMHIFDVCKFWGVRKLYIEKNCVPAIRSARRYISRSQIPCGVEEFHETGNKLKRIVDAWEIPVKSGMIDMHPAIFKDYRTVKQMLDLRHTKLPSPNDRIDAGAKAIRILSESSSVIASTEGPRMMDLDGWLAGTVDQDRGVHAFGPTCGLSHQARFGR